MRKMITLGTVSLAAAAFLLGCGSSSSSDTTLKTGYFIDAPVANCEYTTSSGQKGKTDTHGKFQYAEGDSVKFSLGGLNLGEATPATDGLITPASLTDNEADKVRLLRVLQALDSDGNPNNGITINDSMIKALEKLVSEKNISDFKTDKDILDLNAEMALELDEDFDGEIDVNENDATAHFDDSVQKWDNGEKPDDNQGQGNGNGQDQGSDAHDDGQGFDIAQYPATTGLDQSVINSLAYMGNEERLAYDIYTTLYSYHNDRGEEIKQLTNIPTKSEIKHVKIVQDLVKRYNVDITTVQDVQNPVATKDIAFEDMPTGKYDIVAIQELYDTLYTKGIASKQAALEVGCMVEVIDVDDLDKYITQAQAANASDVVAGFDVLRKGSYNHYWAFDKGLKKMGVSEGCGVLGSDYAKDYPQNEESGHGQTEGGTGTGNGNGGGQGR